MDYRITHCQLGLFGHSPEKKIVTPEKTIGIGLKTALEAATENGRLSCLTAWEIAEQLQIPKIAVSNACEGLGMKIKPCQLGAF
jgi:PIN domain nuclease of toxin-antitoxin system